MNKFGIFNLLNSFLSDKSNNQNTVNTDQTENAPQQDNLLSGIINGLKDNFSSKTPANSQPDIKAPSTIPLQSEMLKTMHSHDQFVKRVKSKQTT